TSPQGLASAARPAWPTPTRARPRPTTSWSTSSTSEAAMTSQLATLGAGGGGFVPTQLAGLQLWLKGGAGTYQDTGLTTAAVADGDPVGGWQDQSGQGHHATQGTAAA